MVSAKKLRICAGLLGMCLAVSACSSTSIVGESEEQESLRRFTPLEFLDYLKTDTRPMRVYTVERPVSCWVKESDIPTLLARLDSNEKAMSVVLGIVSNVRKESREADEAAYLIEGFRVGKYPPSLSSVPVSTEEISEIRRWWISYEAGLAVKTPEAERCELK